MLGIAALVGVLLILFTVWLFTPPYRVAPKSIEKNITFKKAQELGDKLKEKDKDDSVDPFCKTLIYDKGQKTARVIVMYHGYGSCTGQYKAIAERFYNKGYAVILARQPYFGLKDKLSKEQGKISTESMNDFVAETMQIAQGLGDKVTVYGESGGGVLATWAGQYYGADSVAAVEPGFFAGNFPEVLKFPIMRIASVIPPQYFWWNETVKDTKPDGGYPQYTSKGAATFFQMGNQIESEVTNPYKTKSIVLFVNYGDKLTRSEITERIAKKLSQTDAFVSLNMFPAAKGYGHTFEGAPNQSQLFNDTAVNMVEEAIRNEK